MAKMMVRSAKGKVTVAMGLAVASKSAASASSISPGGTWRRQWLTPWAASLAMAMLDSTTVLLRLRRSSHRYKSTSSGSSARHQRSVGH